MTGGNTSHYTTAELHFASCVQHFEVQKVPGQQHRIAHCQIALIEQLSGTFCDHLCHRSHFGSRYSWTTRPRSPFGAITQRSLGFEQDLNKVSSFQASLPLPFPVCLLPHSSHPTNAGCFQMGANSLFKSTPSRIWISNPSP